jgi:hypothetical protein
VCWLLKCSNESGNVVVASQTLEEISPLMKLTEMSCDYPRTRIQHSPVYDIKDGHVGQSTGMSARRNRLQKPLQVSKAHI